MEPICIIKEIYKTLYLFEKEFAEVHDITINEAMLLCCLKGGEAKSAGTISEYIGLSNSRVSKVITAVEEKGYIQPDDARRAACGGSLRPAEALHAGLTRNKRAIVRADGKSAPENLQKRRIFNTFVGIEPNNRDSCGRSGESGSRRG